MFSTRPPHPIATRSGYHPISIVEKCISRAAGPAEGVRRPPPPRLVKTQDEETDVTDEYPEVAAEMREHLRQLAGDAWTVEE